MDDALLMLNLFFYIAYEIFVNYAVFLGYFLSTSVMVTVLKMDLLVKSSNAKTTGKFF